MDNFCWNEIRNGIFPWVNSFSRIIKSAAPLPLNGESIFISSDYSGDLPTCKYNILSLLITDFSRIKTWDIKRRLIRNEYLKDNRRMSFKGLNDIYKQKALPHFLESANHLYGLNVNIVISKQMNSIIESEKMLKKLIQEKMLESNWSEHSFDKMASLAHFIALLIAGMAKPKQNVYWYSDEDGIFANEKRSIDVSKILGMFSGYYVHTELGELGIGTTKLNERDFFEEDINAISDLIAGCLSEFFNKVFEIVDKNSLRDFSYMFPKGLSTKTQNIIDWLSSSSATLKKVTIVFDRLRDTGGYKIWRFDTMPSPIC